MPAPLAALAGGVLKGGLVKGAMVKGVTAKAVGTKALVKTTTVKSGAMRGGGAIVRSGGGASGKLVKSTAKTDKIVKVNNKKSSSIDKKKLMMDEKQRKMEEDRKKRQDEEDKLEQSKDAKKKPDANRSMKKPGGILQKIIDFISTILIGWIVDKIPKLIEFIKKIIKFFQDIGDKIGNFFKSVGELFGKLGSAISGVWEKITSFDLSKVGDTIKEKFNGLKNAFGNILKNIGEGLGLIKKKKNEDPKKIAKDGKLEEGKAQKPEEPTEVKGLKGSLEKVGGEVSKGKENLDAALADATKQITKVTGDAEGDAGKLVKKEVTPTEKKVPTKDKKPKATDTGVKSGGSASPTTPIKGEDDSKQVEVKSNKKTDTDAKITPTTTTSKKTSTTTQSSSSTSSSPSPAKISGTTSSAPVSNITPERKGQDIVVVDDAPPPPDISTPGGSSSTIYIIEDSLNSMVDQQILLDLAYT
tara:strand:- start:9859 stop:11271 length:1413 start_codon:yes stop_codon:yes gene_type:complete